MKEITRKKFIPAQPATEVTRILRSYSHSIGTKIEALTYFEKYNEQTKKHEIDYTTERNFTIMSKEYEALMAAYPSWSPDKPGDTFRPIDILLFLEFKGE